MRLPRLAIALGLCAAFLPSPAPAQAQPPLSPAPSPALDGAAIYEKHCVECHGKAGEGVAGKYDDPLSGERTIASLARYIDRTMPEDREDELGAEESERVAAYIFDAFYSPAARQRLNPARVAAARLTNRQFRESVADLFGSFDREVPQGAPVGLQAEYFQSDGMNKKQRRFASREDRRLDFDFGEEAPVLGCSPEQYSVVWNGSLLPTETGWHEFRLTTPNGARFYLNVDFQRGDRNSRDDGDGRRAPALVDMWVSSGMMMRTETVRVHLLGGRAYPLRLDYFKYLDRLGSVKLEWKPPGGVFEVLGAPYLSPAPATHVTVVDTEFPADDASEGYERGTEVSKAWHEATTLAALSVANQALGRLNRLADVGDDSPDRVEKLRAFVATLAERAFRRPMPPEERQRFTDHVFAEGLAPELAVKRGILLVLKSPRFLYPDLGMAADDHAVASRLALTLWDSLPDEPLRQAAAAGQLHTPEHVRAHAERMLPHPRTRAKMHEFFRTWLVLDKGVDVRKDTDAYPGFDATLVADLRRSLSLFADGVVWGPQSDYRELLQSDHLLMNRRLAAYYGAPEPAEDDFLPVSLDAGNRAGILTHPYLLASHSYFRTTSPIHRGVFLTRHVMGRALKSPPVAISFEDMHLDPSLTMREKVTEITRKDACMGCHAAINPLGFNLENFDAVGRFRTVDNQKPVDAAVDYTTAEGETVKLRSPREMAEHATATASARRGFIRQLFNSFVKQPPAAYGADTLEQLDARFIASGHNIRSLVTELAVRAALPPEAARHASR